MVEVGYARPHAQMAAAAENAVAANSRILDTARAYVEFAAAHPHLYQLMNSTDVDAHGRFRALPLSSGSSTT